MLINNTFFFLTYAPITCPRTLKLYETQDKSQRFYRHCHWTSYNVASISPSIPPKRILIIVRLAEHFNSCFHGDGEALLLANMIKEQNTRGGLNDESRGGSGSKEVHTLFITNVCDCPRNGHDAIEFVNC